VEPGSRLFGLVWPGDRIVAIGSQPSRTEPFVAAALRLSAALDSASEGSPSSLALLVSRSRKARMLRLQRLGWRDGGAGSRAEWPVPVAAASLLIDGGVAVTAVAAGSLQAGPVTLDEARSAVASSQASELRHEWQAGSGDDASDDDGGSSVCTLEPAEDEPFGYPAVWFTPMPSGEGGRSGTGSSDSTAALLGPRSDTGEGATTTPSRFSAYGWSDAASDGGSEAPVPMAAPEASSPAARRPSAFSDVRFPAGSPIREARSMDTLAGGVVEVTATALPLGVDLRGTRVDSVLEGSPLARSGLVRAGDELVGVDDVDLLGMPADEARRVLARTTAPLRKQGRGGAAGGLSVRLCFLRRRG